VNGPVEWPSIEAFWLDDIRRWGSMQADFGVHWRELPRRWPPWRVSHLQATGELIAVCQRSVPGGSGPVRLIAVIPADPREPGEVWYRTLERMLDGWADAPGGDLAWISRRLAARGVEVLTDAWQ
jgi:hypothetical protein